MPARPSGPAPSAPWHEFNRGARISRIEDRGSVRKRGRDCSVEDLVLVAEVVRLRLIEQTECSRIQLRRPTPHQGSRQSRSGLEKHSANRGSRTVLFESRPLVRAEYQFGDYFLD